MVHHIVMWKFKPEIEEAERPELKKAMNENWAQKSRIFGDLRAKSCQESGISDYLPRIGKYEARPCRGKFAFLGKNMEGMGQRAKGYGAVFSSKQSSPLKALARMDFFKSSICARTASAASLIFCSFARRSSRMRTISCCSAREGIRTRMRKSSFWFIL